VSRTARRAASITAVTVVVSLAAAMVVATPAAAAPVPYDGPSPVLINEVANGGERSDADGFIELRNVSDAPVDLTGWDVFRCTANGTRVNTGRPEGDMTGVTLAPGDTFTISKIGVPGDVHVSEPLPIDGFGVVLVAPGEHIADQLGVFPNEPWMMQSECSGSENLPNRLDFSRGESWQRVAATGTPSLDFIVAEATPDAPNRQVPSPRSSESVRIAEIASSGPSGDADEFVELVNDGEAAVDLGGWTLSRCTASGRMRDDTVQLTIADGTRLAPGERVLVAGAEYSGGAPAIATAASAMADLAFGVALADADGLLVDRVAVARLADSACQDDETKLTPIADALAAESYQRADDGWVVAPRTPGEENASVQHAVFDEPFAYADEPGVAISEVATDPAQSELPDDLRQRNWIELANYGSTAIDLSGWQVRRCQADGRLAIEPQVEIAAGTVLEPGETWIAAREGTDAAAGADAVYSVSLNLLGAGVWIEDAAGRRIDSMGAFALNELDAPHVPLSPCTKGLSLPAFLPDRMLGETFQRTSFTGDDADDFVAAGATPGELDLLQRADPTARVAVAEPASADVAGRLQREPVSTATMTAVSTPTPATVIAAWSGAVDGDGLPGGPGADATETPVTDFTAAIAGEGWARPYLRLQLDATALEPGATVSWTGTTLERAEVQLFAWDHESAAWRLLDAGGGAPVTLEGRVTAADIADGVVTVLVHDGDRVESTLAAEPDGAFEDPADYDVSLVHVTDTQYLSEAYPAVYARMLSWIADEADERRIGFVQHTGDLVQNWVDPDQSDERAVVEYERASAIQSILDDAGIPNAVLPGNHDTKRGLDHDLFNVSFGPQRYEDQPWYGESIAPGDNRASWSRFEAAGAEFVVLTLPYGYGEAELAWAERVVAEQAGANVIIATHEHLRPQMIDEATRRSDASRWNSRADELWARVVEPNRNVIMVLSGHFHGIGTIVSDDVGGTPGRTVAELLADYQEFRTHTGARATGFFRMLQFDIDGGAIAVDTRSIRLGESASAEYDYLQVKPENGLESALSNNRPWNVVDAGLQGRYDALDDEFRVELVLQHDTLVATAAIEVVAAPSS
jgi:hypothetical protein